MFLTENVICSFMENAILTRKYVLQFDRKVRFCGLSCKSAILRIWLKVHFNGNVYFYVFCGFGRKLRLMANNYVFQF